MSSIAKVKLEDLHPQYQFVVIEDIVPTTPIQEAPQPPLKKNQFMTSNRRSPKKR
jgi:hypothetical protein